MCQTCPVQTTKWAYMCDAPATSSTMSAPGAPGQCADSGQLFIWPPSPKNQPKADAQMLANGWQQRCQRHCNEHTHGNRNSWLQEGLPCLWHNCLLASLLVCCACCLLDSLTPPCLRRWPDLAWVQSLVVGPVETPNLLWCNPQLNIHVDSGKLAHISSLLFKTNQQ